MTEVLNAEIQPQFEDNLKAQGELYYHHELNGKVAEVLDTENKPEIDDNAQAEENEIKCYRINVLMPCAGCSRSVGRALDNLPVLKQAINLQDQLVDVWTTKAYDDVLAAIKKTGKEVVDGKEIPVLPGDLTD